MISTMYGYTEATQNNIHTTKHGQRPIFAAMREDINIDAVLISEMISDVKRAFSKSIK